MNIRLYIREILYAKYYIIAVAIIIFLSYSVYLFFDEKLVSRIGSEDNFFEWMTSLCLLASSFISWKLFRLKKNFFFLILAMVFFFGFGEEISWGQRIFQFNTPEKIASVNVQQEFNIHNLVFFNSKDQSGASRHGLSRLMEVNFLFKMFTILYGIILPLAAFHLSFVKRINGYFKVPVPPFTVGIFFMINWLVFRILLSYFLPSGNDFQFYDTDTEIFEFVSSAVLLIISIFFLVNRNLENSLDIKFQLPDKKPGRLNYAGIPGLWRSIVLLGVKRTGGDK